MSMSWRLRRQRPSFQGVPGGGEVKDQGSAHVVGVSSRTCWLLDLDQGIGSGSPVWLVVVIPLVGNKQHLLGIV
jgi:hypothetical protein